jgi:hypothetical protein
MPVILQENKNHASTLLLTEFNVLWEIDIRCRIQQRMKQYGVYHRKQYLQILVHFQ